MSADIRKIAHDDLIRSKILKTGDKGLTSLLNNDVAPNVNLAMNGFLRQFVSDISLTFGQFLDISRFYTLHEVMKPNQ